ncbi:MAG: dephospho-CoA kinase [Candidatus Omnitrophica bacterium]|nr:dephospho-CoA kinase [Candidatus Omnitrophota bacterium]
MPKQNQPKIVIGITGSFGCGKSTVARMFKTAAAELIDADKVAHEALRQGGAVYRKIVSFFGKGILKGDKNIDRAKLAGIVFINSLALKKLNRLVHPLVIKEILRRIKYSQKKMVILDAPLIIESGLRPWVDKLVVVTVKPGQQFSRTKSRCLNKVEVSARIKSQISQAAKARFADFIIDNSGLMNETRKQVSEIRRMLWKS